MVLTLAHLVGDFVLMPSRFYLQKEQSLQIVLVHDIIVGGSAAAVCFLLLGKESWRAMLAAVLLHFGVDIVLYIVFRERRGPLSLRFLFDQWLHLMAAVLVTAVFPVQEARLAAADQELVRLLVLLLAGTYFCSLGEKLALRDLYPRYYRDKPLFSRSERPFDCLYGGVMVVLLGGIPQWYFAVLAVLCLSAVYFACAGKLIQQRPQVSVVKILFTVVFIPAMFQIFQP